MPATSLAVIIGGVCAAITLIAATARSLFKAVGAAQLNTKNLTELDTQVHQHDEKLDQHEVRLSVLEATANGDKHE